MNSDETFAIVRRFGRMSSRVLLHLQNDLTKLEKELDDLDKEDAEDPTRQHRLRGFEDYEGWDTTQRMLLSRIREKYCEYGKLPIKIS